LIDEISDSAVRVVKLIAPAGYGKTTLVQSLLEEHRDYARVDLERVTTAVEIWRRLIVATAPFQREAIRSDIPELLIGLGDREHAWEQLAADSLAALPSNFILNFENAEALGENDALQGAIERTIGSLPSDARIVVCSRQNVLRFGRFAGPDRTRMLSARDLRLTVSEIRELFKSLNLAKGDIDAIERFTQGWPIVVMMLFALAKRGRLRAYLTERDDVSDLYGYLASEVYVTLPALESRLLEVLTAIPNSSDAELALLFPDDDVHQAIQSLQAETPFVTIIEGKITLHPALREMIAARVDVDASRAKLFDLLANGGRERYMRAAEIAILRNRPLDAARVLAENATLGGFWTPYNAEILSLLPDEVYYDYPALWGSAQYFRSSQDAASTILMSQRLLARIADDTAPEIRIDIMAALIQMLANRGHFVDAQEVVNAFDTHPSLAGNPEAAILKSFFRAILALYRGDPMDIDEFQSEFSALFITSPIQQSFRDLMILAPYHRLRGDYALERAAIERGMEIATATKFPFVIGIGYTYGAMSAWFWGDDVLFDSYIATLEATLTPSTNNAFQHLLQCAHGQGAVAKTAAEKMDMRVYAYAIAASRTRVPAERRALAEAALTAARQSSMRFCEVIARVVLALCDLDGAPQHLDRADALAGEMASPALTLALRALRNGTPQGTMLEALSARFAASADKQSSATISIDCSDGSVRVGDQEVALSPRERELLVFLAEHPGVAHAQTIAEKIWPESPRDRRLLSLRVTINRLRKRIGDHAIIVASPHGYALGASTLVEPSG
jgi:hypothetical protein